MQVAIPAPTPRSRPWLAALAGFVTAAAILVVLVLIGVLRSNDESAPSRAPITMPRTVGNYASGQLAYNGNHIGPQLAYERLSAAKTAATLSEAHDGAGAGVQAYVDPFLHNTYTVLAVRDATPPPVLGIENPKLMGGSPQRIVRIGSSYCELDALQPSPVAVDVASCQRSSPALTVTVLSGTSHDPRAVVALVDRIWRAIS